MYNSYQIVLHINTIFIVLRCDGMHAALPQCTIFSVTVLANLHSVVVPVYNRIFYDITAYGTHICVLLAFTRSGMLGEEKGLMKYFADYIKRE